MVNHMSLSNLEVQITNDHINKLLRFHPIRALSELIWNALDADATEIEIDFERNALDGLEHIIIRDNGHGIHFDQVKDFFGKLGDSHKTKRKTSPKGRRYHGKLGQGRYSGFVLGKTVEWICLYENDLGILHEFSITGNKNELKIFQKSVPQMTLGTKTGVTVSITNLIDENADDIAEKFTLIQNLTMVFAPYCRRSLPLTEDGRRFLMYGDGTKRL
jgi:DNA topoisomerase VI subunit B